MCAWLISHDLGGGGHGSRSDRLGAGPCVVNPFWKLCISNTQLQAPAY